MTVIQLPLTNAINGVLLSRDGRRAWAAANDGTILRSMNGGANWSIVRRGAAEENLKSISFAADERTGLAGGYGGTLLRTTDGGASWSVVRTESTTVYAVALAGNGRLGFSVGNGGRWIFRTTNGGLDWSSLSSGHVLYAVAASADGQRGWAVGAKGAILRTLDAGLTWTSLTNTVTHGFLFGVTFAADGDRGWIVGSGGAVYRTTDGGGSWSAAEQVASGSLYSISFANDGRRGVAVGADNSVLVTTDGGRRWSAVPTPGSDYRLKTVSLAADGRLALAAGASGTVLQIQIPEHFVVPEPAPKPHEPNVTASVPRTESPKAAESKLVTFFKSKGALVVGLLCVGYALGVLALYAMNPWWLVVWQERFSGVVVRVPLIGPSLKDISALAGLFLVTSDRCLNAVVMRFATQALGRLEAEPEVATRRVWVAAPFEVGDEVYGTPDHPFTSPTSDLAASLYVRGLSELRRHLVGKRWWIAIEGPGGVGKSSLAFQLARWFAAEPAAARSNLPRAIPILVRNLGDGLDREVLAELREILGFERISPDLQRALLSRRRVLAIVDGVSEKAGDFSKALAGPLNPAKGASLSHLVVLTSRRRIDVTDSLRVVPKLLDERSVGETLQRYVDGVVGAGRFGPDQHEAILRSLLSLMRELSRERDQSPEIPMLFLKLFLQRADGLLSEPDADSQASRAGAASLPGTLGDLVDAFLANLFENTPDRREQILRAHQAALACIGRNGLPSWRTLVEYEQQGLKFDPDNELLVTAGLMLKDGTDERDPHFKFALDPIAEYLAAKELVLAVRDRKLSLQELAARRQGFSKASEVNMWIRKIGRDVGVSVDSDDKP